MKRFSMEEGVSVHSENISDTQSLIHNSNNNNIDEREKKNGRATVLQTSINMAKICMGSGTLALPYAATVGGLLFNIIGLCLIGLWNYYSSNCLLRCLDYLPTDYDDDINQTDNKDNANNGQSTAYGATTESKIDSTINGENRYIKHPPPGTTTYGQVAFYACGSKGLYILDILMLLLFFGLVISYEVIMMSFIDDTPFTTGNTKVDLLIPSSIVVILSSLPDVGFLSKCSGLGLMAVAISFIVITLQGLSENGMSGFREDIKLKMWPEDVTSLASWYGVVVFGYGVVPFIYNFRDSMHDPNQVNDSLRIGLSMVYFGYVSISNGISILFSPSFTFEEDVLQSMPGTSIALLVRLLFIIVISLTAPLIVIPSGELIEGKLGLKNSEHTKKILVRVVFCLVCIGLAEYIPGGFVHVVSFIGCFCVSLTSFVLPPLFVLQLSSQQKKTPTVIDSVKLCDFGVFLLGIISTIITSALTFRELILRPK